MNACLRSWYVAGFHFLFNSEPETDFTLRFKGLTKTIPGTPEGQTPIHEKLNPIYKPVQK